MRTQDADILIVPGLGNSDEEHWQSRWEAKLSSAHRIDLGNWYRPDFDVWRERIESAVAEAARPVVFIAHSLGAIAVAHAARRFDPGRVRGAFLVSPPSEPAIANIAAIDPRFLPFPRDRLGFSSLVVGSSNDPFSSLEDMKALAGAWGAEWAEAGESGHINVSSGHGPWPEGLLRFAGFLRKL